jgi:hypothetical protein
MDAHAMKMKKYLLTLVCLWSLLSTAAMAQSPERRMELGIILLTVNAMPNISYVPQRNPSWQWLPSLFWRYDLGKWALRAQAGYGQRNMTYSDGPIAVDGMSSEMLRRAYKLGVGAQYAIPKTKGRLYGCLDIAYRRLHADGSVIGGFVGWNNRFVYNANGLDADLGLGYKFIPMPWLTISPEIAADGYLSKLRLQETNAYTGQSTTTDASTFQLRPIAQLQVAARF